MVPLSDYATVSEEDSLVKAFKVLKQARDDEKFIYKHRAVLVYDKDENVVGKVSIRDFLKAIEPKYNKFEDSDSSGGIGLSRFGLSQKFLNAMVENFNLWEESLEDLVKKSLNLKVKDFMYSPSREEYIDIDSSLSGVVHQFIMGSHQSLLVLDKGKVVGILRLTDVFNLVAEML